MKVIQFEWDEKKNKANIRKHGIPFEEAKTVFYDENARIIDDPDHSEEEDRFIILGLSSEMRLKNMEDKEMKREYDFTRSRKNPYIKKLKKQITIRIDVETIEYFKELSEETGIGYQNLMNMYLEKCAKQNLKPEVEWTRV
jgi:uncharacterized DUF497 family protein